ncbi:metadherin a isoform X1 [Osmerus eperlanus]|uniref:metadherin a isoform X1 n=2 Tax=Osmerus eperlanus TaxID=29151 RepID=UPI002E127C6E
MATDWQALAMEQAELISSRLREILSSGQGYIRSQFGVELGLRPELYPSWAVLLTAVVGVLVVLVMSWAALCGSGKKRITSATYGSGGGPVKAPVIKTVKSEEQKKKIKKKSVDKAQSNGRTVPEPKAEVRAGEEIPKSSPLLAPEVETEKPVLTQVKKSKKKPKQEVKPAKNVLVSIGKELDDGAWETKVSNREKKQQRRKDKGPDDSGSPGGVEAPSFHTNPPTVTAPLHTNRKNKEPQRTRTGGKGDVSIAPVNLHWREEPSVNGGGWADVSTKLPSQMAIKDWPAITTGPRHRNPESQTWNPDMEGTWSGVDSRIKPELKPVTFSVPGMNTTASEPKPHFPADRQRDNQPACEDVWSNGIDAADPSSDWNAPTELWGNYEEPVVVEAAAPPPQEQAAPQVGQVSDEEMEDAASGGTAKSKKKKKKKKKLEDEGVPAQVRKQLNKK